MLDPLAVFLRSTFDGRGLTPIPLISTDHEVAIAAGLAVVTTHRLFKNIESKNIEAVLTFPLPVLAVLFELTAEVEGRKLRGSAQAHAEARRTYEDAIDRGKSAVLHEELLRGVHMISVANIESGGEIKVTTKWALPLSVIGDRASLRIPQTVGDIYGRSSLPEADAILTGGQKQPVSLSINSDGNVAVVGADLVGGHAKLTNSRPIDIVADIWNPRPIIGNSASAGSVALTLSPQPAGERALSLAVLVDHSGSMADSSGGQNAITVHDAARNGVVSLASCISSRDHIDLWEFDTSPRHVGSVTDGSKAKLLRIAASLSPPRGGTEIGRAIDAVLKKSTARDVLLLTDGLSEELDVEKLSQSGRRISVILIGERSLEAKIGHLAALTGGDIFIATANDLNDVMAAAIEGLRRAHTPLSRIKEAPERLECARNNVHIQAKWSSDSSDLGTVGLDRAAVAVATSLIVSCASVELASKIAASEGIVSHLTSLVLVDEASNTQEALPTLRKVALPEPEVSYSACYDSMDGSFETSRSTTSEMSSAPLFERSIRHSQPATLLSSSRAVPSPAPRVRMASPDRTFKSLAMSKKPSTKLTGSDRRSAANRLLDRVSRGLGRTALRELRDILNNDIRTLASELGVDWAGHAPQLASGDASCLPPFVQVIMSSISEKRPILELARALAIDELTVVLGLTLLSLSKSDRHAKRIAKRLLGDWQSQLPKRKVELIGEILEL